MKLRRLATACALALAASVACSKGPPASEKAASLASPDSLASAFRHAHERRDVPALLALFKSDCAASDVTGLIESTLRSHLDDPIQAIRVELPFSGRATTVKREDGKTYELSVPLHGEMVVVYDSTSGRRSSYPFGPVNGVLRFGTMCVRP